MGTKHVHYDVIVAWAAGEEIQFGTANYGLWQDWKKKYAPSFHPDLEWRIKPKRVKKEGWVNVYKSRCDTVVGATGYVFPTKERADNESSEMRLACIRIEWEEEE